MRDPDKTNWADAGVSILAALVLAAGLAFAIWVGVSG